jgi:peptidoglycan/LPS O-acetylase OafA/YrhL
LALVTTSITCFVTTISGWPFRPEVTPFTYNFLVYPVFLVAALSRRYPPLRITATALLFGFTTFSHVYFETPFDQYRTRAEGSPVPLHGIQHTLLNTESRTAGILAATITVLLSLLLGLALWQFILERRRGETAK